MNGQTVYDGDMVEVDLLCPDDDMDMSYMDMGHDGRPTTVLLPSRRHHRRRQGMTITVRRHPGELYAMQTMVTMMMPPMELGAPSITSVMSDADGMADGHADARRQRHQALGTGQHLLQ